MVGREYIPSSLLLISSSPGTDSPTTPRRTPPCTGHDYYHHAGIDSASDSLPLSASFPGVRVPVAGTVQQQAPRESQGGPGKGGGHGGQFHADHSSPFNAAGSIHSLTGAVPLLGLGDTSSGPAAFPMEELDFTPLDLASTAGSGGPVTDPLSAEALDFVAARHQGARHHVV